MACLQNFDEHNRPECNLSSTENSLFGTTPASNDIDVPDGNRGSYGVSRPNQPQLGEIEFSLSFNETSERLSVKIHRAIQLTAKEFSGTGDPYVRISILPEKVRDGKQYRTTSIRRKNLNPQWNEEFYFEGELCHYGIRN